MKNHQETAGCSCEQGDNYLSQVGNDPSCQKVDYIKCDGVYDHVCSPKEAKRFRHGAVSLSLSLSLTNRNSLVRSMGTLLVIIHAIQQFNHPHFGSAA